MISLLSRVIATVRDWVGLNDPADDRLYPSHGWLLAPAADTRALARDRALALSPARLSAASGKRR